MNGQNADAAKPLVTKEEHLSGEKLLTLTLRWGEQIVVRLVALGWRKLQQLSSLANHHKWDPDTHSFELVKASLPNVADHEKLMDSLEAESAALLQRTALAFSLGERSIKNDPSRTGDPATMPTTTAGSSTAGEPSAPSSPAAGPDPRLWDGALPDSPSPTTNTGGNAPVVNSDNCASSMPA